MSSAPTILRRLVAVLALSLLAAACTDGEDATADETTTTSLGAPNEDEADGPIIELPDEDAPARGGAVVDGTEPEPPSASELASVASLPGLLAVGAGGRLAVTTPDGTEVAVLAEAPDSFATEAVWSPTGPDLAWVDVGPAGPSLTVTRGLGAEAEPIEPATLASPVEGGVPFYLHWSPDGQRLGLLGDSSVGTGLDISLLTPGGSPQAVASAVPLYFAWSLSGEELAFHFDGARVSRLVLGPPTPLPDAPETHAADADGAAEETEPPAGSEEDGDEVEDDPDAALPRPEAVLTPSGAFTAPDWIDDRTLVVVAEEGLALLDVVTGQTEILVEATEDVRFVVSPDRRRIAYHLPELNPDGVSLVSYTPIQEEQGPQISGLVVLDIDRRTITQVSPSIPLSFEWSPDGSTLAWLANGFDGVVGRTGWSFWDGFEITLAEPYRVSALDEATVFPFFEQYAQSHSRWSPDGTAFAFAGVLDGRPDDEASGIWVHRVGTGGPSVRVATGDRVDWGG
ncbi:MAG: hypothetical protein AAGA59_08525 [Actinomycetota bacterium]